MTPEQPGPRFSVLIPVWRGARWVNDALASVLAQTLSDLEVVVADNASDDDTVALARATRDPRVRVEAFAEHVPIFDNFNRGFAQCNGAWVYLLPVDDRLAPNALERIAHVIDRHAGSRPLVAVWPHARRIDATGRPIDVRYHGAQGEARIAGGTYGAAAWLEEITRPGSPPWDGGTFRRATVQAMGTFFRADIPSMSADFEVSIRIAAYGDVAYIDEPLLLVTGSEESHTPGRVRENLARAERFTPRGRALAEGLAAHAALRPVGRDERRRVRAAIARTHLRRATAHRTLDGGLGRRGAWFDVWSAARLAPQVVARSLVQALLTLLAPASVIRASREAVLWVRRRRSPTS